MFIWCEGDELSPPVPNRPKRLVAAFQQLPDYPPRTASPIQLSPPFQALKDLLSEAPVMGDHGLPIKNEQNTRVDDLPAEQDFRVFWSEEYFTRIYRALMDIIGAHGVGPDGWEAARWMVYDEVRAHARRSSPSNNSD